MANKSPRDEEGKKLVYTAKATKNISRVSFVNQTDQVLTTSTPATHYASSVINLLFIDLSIDNVHFELAFEHLLRVNYTFFSATSS